VGRQHLQDNQERLPDRVGQDRLCLRVDLGQRGSLGGRRLERLLAAASARLSLIQASCRAWSASLGDASIRTATARRCGRLVSLEVLSQPVVPSGGGHSGSRSRFQLIPKRSVSQAAAPPQGPSVSGILTWPPSASFSNTACMAARSLPTRTTAMLSPVVGG
jgi:hypothetical protein